MSNADLIRQQANEIWKQKHFSDRGEYQHQYYLKHKEEILQKRREYYKKKKENR